MLHVVTGLFHPDLERALTSDLRSFTVEQPLAPRLIIVPSASVRTYLKWSFCIEKRQPLFNVHLLTFHQLALRVLEERGLQIADHLRGESFFREWVHQRLCKRGEDLVGLNELASMPGGWAALWATLKDLKDARVDAGSALEAFSQQTPFSTDRRLQAVVRLYQAWCDDQSRHSWYDHDDVAALALDLVAASSWLRQQAHIFYYGFYDLTQGQLDLFRMIVRQYPATLYFPLLDQHPAFCFAQQFFDQHIRGLAAGPIERRVETVNGSPFRDLFDPAQAFRSREPDVPDGPSRSPVNTEEKAAEAWQKGNRSVTASDARGFCRLVTVSGANDEIEVVAKEILTLTRDLQIPFYDIGVVGRTLAGYEDVLPRVFSAHGVPFQATLGRPLSQHPFPQAVLRLLMLRLSGLDRNATFDVLRSPFVNWRTFCPEVTVPRPDAWERISRQVGIEKGPREWDRLDRFFETGVSTPYRRRRGEHTIAGEEVRNLRHVTSRLTQLLLVFPEQASWDVFTDQALFLMDHVLTGPSLRQDARSPEGEGSHGVEGAAEFSRVHQAVLECFAELRTLTNVSESIQYADFLSTLKRFMEERFVWNPPQPEKTDGVRVVDAMAARGLSFRFLFVIGLTDHVFPRHIREDGFCRDSARRFLDMHLGFKIQEKIRGYDEEKLLFYLLMHAVRERVTLVAQRSDEEGRTTTPSWYLQEVERCMPGLSSVEVPRSVLQKPQAALCADEAQWTPRERFIRYVLRRHRPTRAAQAADVGPAWWQMVKKGLAVLRAQESERPKLNARDGMTGPLPEHWKFLSVHGLSPTSLERYAVCPFQYFAEVVLGLHVARTTSSGHGLRAFEVGTLLHRILREWYDRLGQSGWFARVAPSDFEPLGILKQVAESAFRDFEGRCSVGPALLWEMRQEQLLSVLERILQQDEQEMGHEWIPVLFEVSLKGETQTKTSRGTTSLPIIGRLDRVDWSPSLHRYRIIDYKFTEGRVMTDQQLARAVVRGRSLQPLLYMELARQGVPPLLKERPEPDGQTVTCEGVWLYVVAPPRVLPEDRGFAPVAFSSRARDRVTPQLETAMTTIVQGIQQGKFFIVPGSHCEWCRVRSVCHRTHPGSARRAREDRRQTAAHRNLRRQQPPSSPATPETDHDS